MLPNDEVESLEVSLSNYVTCAKLERLGLIIAYYVYHIFILKHVNVSICSSFYVVATHEQGRQHRFG